MSSWVESGLDPASFTSAPASRSASIRTAVSFVTCRQTPRRTPSRGRSLEYFCERVVSAPKWAFAQRKFFSPAALSLGLASFEIRNSGQLIAGLRIRRIPRLNLGQISSVEMHCSGSNSFREGRQVADAGQNRTPPLTNGFGPFGNGSMLSVCPRSLPRKRRP